MITKFGIEIEFLGMGDSCWTVARYLANRGLPANTCRDSDDDNDRDWVVKEDGSVFDDSNSDMCEYMNDEDDEPCGDCENCNGERGCEIVSPPMHYSKESLETVEKFVGTIRFLGGYTNDTCGLHVHVDASFLENMTTNQQRRFFKHIRSMYATFEDSFDSRMAFSRRQDRNVYCHSMKANYGDECRYLKLNTCSYVQHGTIEFRHHHGTLNADEITSWIKTCLIFVEHARNTFDQIERESWQANA